MFGWLAADPNPADAATRVERIAMLERIKAAAAAAQSAEVVAFAKSQVVEQQSAGVDYRRLGRGIADQVGMATPDRSVARRPTSDDGAGFVA